MLMYVAATNQFISIALIVEHPKDGITHGVQNPAYYATKVLSPAKQQHMHYQ
jgi:hypothetical protein